MAEEPQRYDLRAVRQLLLTAFTAEELHDLFYFSRTPELREVPNQFAPGDSYPTMVRKAVRYCDSRYLLGEMLAEVEEANPRAYEKFGGTLRARPAAAAPGARPRWLVPALAAGAALILIVAVVVLVIMLPRVTDADGDGLTGAEEARLGTDRRLADTDGDELSDGDEVYLYFTDPTLWDSDEDGISDGDEVNGYSGFDGVEFYYTDPTLWDTDKDGFSDYEEVYDLNTDPNQADTDAAQAERQFIVVGLVGVAIRGGPGDSYDEQATVWAGDRLEVVDEPRPGDGSRWWPVRTTAGTQGWVAEWAADRRQIKPVMEVRETVLVVNPVGEGNVHLLLPWGSGDTCDPDNQSDVRRGTDLTVIGEPDPDKCSFSREQYPEIVDMGVQFWFVETPDGTTGWLYDFHQYDWGGWVKPMRIAPRWYAELAEE